MQRDTQSNKTENAPTSGDSVGQYGVTATRFQHWFRIRGFHKFLVPFLNVIKFSNITNCNQPMRWIIDMEKLITLSCLLVIFFPELFYLNNPWNLMGYWKQVAAPPNNTLFVIQMDHVIVLSQHFFSLVR